MNRRLLLAGLLGGGLSGCGLQSGLSRLTPGERGRVVEVRSGETIVLDSGLVVRLTGVDAPNLLEPWAREASTVLTDLLQDRPVTLLYGGARRDRYDRALAHIQRDKGQIWVQQALLEAGAVRVHTWSDNRALAKPMLHLEATAREQGRGVWRLPDYRVLLPSEAIRRHGFLIVEGRVRSALREGGRTRIVFAEGGLEALLQPGVLESRAIKPGSILRLRGWAAGDRLRIDHPEALEWVRTN